MAFLYVPNGAIMADWTPETEGAGFELPAILQPLAPFRDDLLVLSGLTCDKGRPNGDGGGDHARASSAFLTGCQARKTAGANFRSGISADQVAASRLGERTRLPSLELGIERYRGTGNCDSGYSCVYEHTISWRSPTSPLPNEVDPRLVFERLFSERPNDPDRLKRNRLRASVLDAVHGRRPRLEQPAGRRRPSEAGPVPLLRPRAGTADRPRRDPAAGPAARRRGQAAAGSGRPGGALPPDVRPDGAGVPDRRDPHHHLHVRPRGERAEVPDGRHLRGPPRADPPPEQPGEDRQGPHDQHLSTSSNSPTCSAS